MTTPTRERLAAALGEAGLSVMQQRAAAGYYDDFESPLATPIIQLVADLREAGREDLAQRAINGEWDCTPEESQAWAESADGQAVIKELIKGGGQ